MNYEQKYKEALGWMQSLYKGLHGITKEDAEHYFPELKESEDEKIRKVLLNDFKNNCSEYYCEGVNRDMIIAWLEKQGEFKSSKWTEGDVVRHGGVLALVTNGRKAMKSNCEQITIQYPDEWVKAETKERKYFFEQLEKQGEQPTEKVEQNHQKQNDYDKRRKNRYN